MQDCGLSVNLSQLPSATTPLHIVLWKGVDTASPTVSSYSTTEETIKVLRDRISALEAMVSGLIETQKASQWFPSGLRPTPTGIEVVSRRESMGGESDMGAVLSQLVRPVEETRSVELTRSVDQTRSMNDAALGPEPMEEVIEQEQEQEEVEVEEEQEDEQEEEVDVEVVEEQEEEQEGQEAEEEVVEYKPVEWKGQTYYVDGNLDVYEMDSDGDLIETPIGQWREATQKLVRYKSA